MGQRGTLTIDGTRVPVTNLDKVLFPKTGFTKAAVIDYYIRISDVLLPHLQNRPITLKRYPDGVDAPYFYEKDAPKFTPEWVQTFKVPRRTGEAPIRYILVNDLRTLVWCANIANLELHPFLHRIPDIATPREMVFDLDPGPGTDLLTCTEVAFEIQHLLDSKGLRAFPKVSGSKGMQISVPLNTPTDYDTTQAFAKAVGRQLASHMPDRVVFEMAKSLRSGKVLIDWSQNSDFKTTVGVYSLRAKQDQPFVSMPVTWQELEKAVSLNSPVSLRFPPADAIARAGKLGDLFAPVLTLQQELSAPDFPPRTVRGKAGIRRAAKLEFVEPMQALPAAALPEGPGWTYEVKFDGYRTLALCSGEEVRLLSRRNKLMNERFAPLVDSLRKAEAGTIFDGEVIALDDEGRPSFHVLQNHRLRTDTLLYYIFDLLIFRGQDLTKLPWKARRSLLEEQAFRGLDRPLMLSPVLKVEPASLVEAVRAQGLEGVIAKRTTSLYEAGKRTGAWVKVRVNKGQELVVGGYKPGPRDFDYLLVGYYDQTGDLRFVAKLKNGFDSESRSGIAARLRELTAQGCPFANLPEPRNARRGEAVTAAVMRSLRWVRPELVVQVEYVDWTEADHLRHASFAGIRDDKIASDVRKEL